MTTTSSAPASTAYGVDPVAMLRDPYETYDRLRELGPVVWVPVMNRYLATTFEACRAIEADQETYSASISGAGATMARALGAQPMLRKDDPDHAAERGPINPAMRPRRIRETWVPRFERNARIYLARLIEHGPDNADLNRDFAAPLAAHNLIDMLGLAEAGPADMQRWSHALIAGIGNLQDNAGFGSGVHLCAGHWAARISIGEIAVPLLYEGLLGLRTDPRRHEEWYGWVFRGLTALPVTWGRE